MNYLQAVKRPSYNFVFSGILLVLYEAIIFFTPSQAGRKVINAVDGWFEMVLAPIPYATLVISLLLLALTAYFIHKDYREEKPFQGIFVGYMWAESLVWALVIYFNLTLLVSALPGLSAVSYNAVAQAAQRPGFIHALGLSFGAGFYEELFFRLLLVVALRYLLKLLGIDFGRWGNGAIIVSVTAVLFSLAHHIPPYGEPFEFYVFVYRAVFGVLMSALLLARGFGITAWTHALYDVVIDIRTYW